MSEQRRSGRHAGQRSRIFGRRQVVGLVATLCVSAATYAAAYFLRFDLTWPARYTSTFLLTLAPLLALRGVADVVFRVNSQRWRYASTQDMVEIIQAVGLSTVAFWLVTLVLPIEIAVPRSVIAIEFVLATYGLGGIRVAYRWISEKHRGRVRRNGSNGSVKRALVAGAGAAGNLIVRELERYPEYEFDVVGFVDDDPSKLGTRIRGIPVMGRTDELERLVERERIDALIVAMPSAEPSELRRVVQHCERCDVEIEVLPSVEEVRKGRVRLSQLRAIRIEDLLVREPVELDLPELAEDLRNRCALITGAAGSIGSELARQVARHGPGSLVLLDQAESDLYLLERELADSFPEMEIIPVVGDIVDVARLACIFREHRPERVYHAAAYKHVPLMEHNPVEAIRNNVAGTLRVAEAAGGHGTGKFVLISTDKAVRPSNIMGVTKRLAELIVLALGKEFPETTYTAVRFGNVLGSQGSVIPIFKRQIEKGESLTVTDPEATRFFMTIPEAAQLVLQASVLGQAGGRVTMLDMGEPVRILELAKNMLRLSGVEGPVDDHIRFIGLRPGEKLHEELSCPDEEAVRTPVPKVLLLNGNGHAAGEMLLQQARAWDERLDVGDHEGLAEEAVRLCEHLDERSILGAAGRASRAAGIG